jgi:hypothetical protein
LLVGQCLDDALLNLEERQFQPFAVMALVAQPQAERVQRLDVGVARDRLDTALAQRDDELLQRGFREVWSGCRVRFLERLERRLKPLDCAGRDVLQVATLSEKCSNSADVDRGSMGLLSLRLFFVFFFKSFVSNDLWCAQQDSNLRPPGS